MKQKTSIIIILLCQGDKQYFLNLITNFYAWKKQFYQNQATQIMEKSLQKLERKKNWQVTRFQAFANIRLKYSMQKKRAIENNFKVPVRTMVI